MFPLTKAEEFKARLCMNGCKAVADAVSHDKKVIFAEHAVSPFCERLRGVGRILELPDYNVWCCSPIYGPDGKVHVFYSRWKNEAGFGKTICTRVVYKRVVKQNRTLPDG